MRKPFRGRGLTFAFFLGGGKSLINQARVEPRAEQDTILSGGVGYEEASAILTKRS